MTYFRVVKYGATVVAVLLTFCVTIVGFIGRKRVTMAIQALFGSMMLIGKKV